MFSLLVRRGFFRLIRVLIQRIGHHNPKFISTVAITLQINSHLSTIVMVLTKRIANSTTFFPPLSSEFNVSVTTPSTFIKLDMASALHDYHGDDACGTGPNCMIVADGVSGTKEASGILARALVTRVLEAMEGLTKLAMEHPMKASDFKNAVETATIEARNDTESIGRLDSTLSVLFIDQSSGGQAYTYTVGDSKCAILRGDGNNRRVVFETASMVYGFNFPASISTDSKMNATNYAEILVTDIQPGDIAILFSDGVGDNLYVDEVVQVVEDNLSNGPSAICTAIVNLARESVNKTGLYIPFAVGAVKAIEDYYVASSRDDGPTGQASLEKQCKALKARTVDRKFFGNEKIVKQLNYYSVQDLFAFANKNNGKRDDISVCVALIN